MLYGFIFKHSLRSSKVRLVKFYTVITEIMTKKVKYLNLAYDTTYHLKPQAGRQLSSILNFGNKTLTDR